MNEMHRERFSGTEDARDGSQEMRLEEALERLREEAMTHVVESGLTLHRDNHDGQEAGQERKDFHNSEHPEGMLALEKDIARALGATPQESQNAQIAIGYHDTVISVSPPGEEAGIMGMVARHRGARDGDGDYGKDGNEGRSATLALARMERMNKETEKEVFTEQDREEVQLGIEFTYPEGSFESFENQPAFESLRQRDEAFSKLMDEMREARITEGLKMSQKHLDTAIAEGGNVPKSALMVALADLGTVGTKEFEFFSAEGDAEARELFANLRTNDTLERLCEGVGPLDEQDREKVTAELLGWLKIQTGFAVHQALRFEANMQGLGDCGYTEDEVQGLRTLFSRFTENARQAFERWKKISEKVETLGGEGKKREALRTILTEMGYSLPEEK